MTLPLTILQMLRQVGDLLVPERQIRTELRLSVSPAPTGSEMSTALHQVEASQLAVSVRDSLTGDVRWKITDAGRAALAERGI